VAAEQDYLVVINAQSFSSAILEQNRERSWQAPYEFRFGKPIFSWQAEDVIRELKLWIEEHEANLKQSRAKKEKQRIFQVWWDILRAKTDWEQQREKPLKYINFKTDGNRRVIFKIEELLEEDIAGQSRHVKNAKGFSLLGGEVIETIGDELHLYVEYGQLDRLPQSGKLLFDTRLAEIALDRQKSALNAVRYDRAVRPDLRNLIVNPQEINTPTLDTEVRFIQNLNHSQKEVVRAALSIKDFLLVEGPPGTGKTTFITEVILQTLQQNPEARILLSSQTHVALDNALERVQQQNPDLKLTRIGHSERVSKGVSPLLLEEQMEKWREEALSEGEKFYQNLEKAVVFQELRNIFRNVEFLEEELEKGNIPLVKRKEKVELLELLEEETKELEKKAKALGENAKFLQKLIPIQIEWFEQFGRNERFNAPLIKRSQVVAGTCIGISREIQDIEFDLCIVDEASKATATEVLVPMSRSKKWLLVGDPKQLPPFLDEASRNTEFLEKYELEPEDIKETLFDRLLKTLPDECRKMLTVQHRMVEPIGKLIGSCFYEGKLDSKGPKVDKILTKVLLKPVTWLTTSKLRNSREQSSNSSFNNSCEVKVIFQWLKQLNQVATEADSHYQVAILSGYGAQLKLLNRSLNQKQKSLPALRIECNTVDAFQGREADIAIYSVTRSNKDGKIGFLRDEARLNVALSRGRVGLLIVGDSQFCRALYPSPLSNVLRYIEQHPEDCICREANL